jgi:formate hydrogenlyase subunit 3/multisubunit Na+/H+ antiporter MnhD subunit
MYSQDNLGLLLSLLFVLVGFGITAAIVPFHMWLPDAHPAAPSPISSLLSGVVIKIGIYGIIRIVIPFFSSIQPTLQIILTLLAVSSMFLGNLLALIQTDLKRLLAYSSIANIGYILLGLSLNTFKGFVGSLFHILNHALIKGLLFMISGVFLYSTGKRDLDSLAGVGKKMRISGALFALASLAIIGVPLLNGFIGEMLIIRACIENEAYILVVLMFCNLLLSAAYYLRTSNLILFKEQITQTGEIAEAPLPLLVPMIILAVLCVTIGIYSQPFMGLIEKTASNVFP